jgi:hypothetical protein
MECTDVKICYKSCEATVNKWKLRGNSKAKGSIDIGVALTLGMYPAGLTLYSLDEAEEMGNAILDMVYALRGPIDGD